VLPADRRLSPRLIFLAAVPVGIVAGFFLGGRDPAGRPAPAAVPSPSPTVANVARPPPAVRESGTAASGWASSTIRIGEGACATPVDAPAPAPPPRPVQAGEARLYDGTVWNLEVENFPEFSGVIGPGEAVFLPPGARAKLRARRSSGSGPGPGGGALSVESAWTASGGEAAPGPEGGLRLVAPARHGVYRVRCGAGPSGGNGALLVFVLRKGRLLKGSNTPHSSVLLDGRLLGPYPDPQKSRSRKVRRHAAAFRPPLYFLTITPETAELRLSPHLALGDCVALPTRPGSGAAGSRGKRHTDLFPPSRSLIRKLEDLAGALRGSGLRFRRFTTVSGFRTPRYNRRVAQSAPFSQHIYGKALDILIDERPADGRMDDLNRDGRHDWRDALVIAEALRKLEAAGRVVPGGIGLYEYAAAKSAGSHVHLDVRGYTARWGVSYRTRTGKPRHLRWWPKGAGGDARED